MNYFVGYGTFDTHWSLPDMPPEEGDVVFLIAWGKISHVLVGLFTVGEMARRNIPHTRRTRPAAPVA